MCKKIRQFEKWFDLHYGWFFTNGNKMEIRNEKLKEKTKTKKP